MNIEKFGRDMPVNEEMNYKNILLNTTAVEDFTDHPSDLKVAFDAELQTQEVMVGDAMKKVADLQHEYRKAPDFNELFQVNDMGAIIDNKSTSKTNQELLKELNNATAEEKIAVLKRNELKDNLDRATNLSSSNPELN